MNARYRENIDFAFENRQQSNFNRLNDNEFRIYDSDQFNDYRKNNNANINDVNEARSYYFDNTFSLQ